MNRSSLGVLLRVWFVVAAVFCSLPARAAERPNVLFLICDDLNCDLGCYGTTLFENAARVPLVMSGPGISTGKVVPTMAEMVDFYPTLAELAGLQKPIFISGVSLVPALRDPAAMPRTSALTQYANGYSLRTPDFRYTQWGADASEGIELYDHRSDPEEMHNVAQEPAYAATIRELAAKLQTRIVAARQPPQETSKSIRRIHVSSALSKSNIRVGEENGVRYQ